MISEVQTKHEALLERWSKARAKYETEGEFTCDGPSNWDNYLSRAPRILFLLKEAKDGFQPKVADQEIPGIFGMNVARWKFLIRKLYENSTEIIAMPENEELRSLKLHINDDIAIVEVKKFDEDKKASDWKEIYEYARLDKDFLKEQIDLINPQIILCGNTGDAYGDHIYGEDKWEVLNSIEKCNCYKHNGRLVIDFWHPSRRDDSRELFESLKKLLKDGKVFEEFDWAKK